MTLNLVRRLTKGSPLTAADHDGNLDKLEDAIETIELTPGPAGASAYQVAVAAGFTGTEAEWLATLVGPAGSDGTDGSPGADGASAYQIAIAGGFTGTEAEWLASLVGPAGADGADGLPGADGSPGADGADGASAYQLAVAGGFVGTEAEWLASLVGPAGADGVDGAPGADGAPGVGVPAGGTTGQFLRKVSGTDYDADWATPITTIDGLTDVTIASAADGEVLTYDSATGQWINSAPSGGGGTPGGTSGQLQWNRSGTFAGVGGSTVGATGDITLSLNGDFGKPPLKLNGTWITGGTGTTTKPQLLIEPAGTTSTSWNTNGTGIGINAASGFNGRYVDVQNNGNSVFSIGGQFGDVALVGTLTLSSFSTFVFGSRTALLTPNLGELTIRQANGTNNTTIASEADDTFAQRRGANPQTYRLYNTFTDGSNYERAYLRWASNILEIGTEGIGTGSTRPVRIRAATLKLPNLPTYAGNAAALTDGLVAGDVYKTATGELRITV